MKCFVFLLIASMSCFIYAESEYDLEKKLVLSCTEEKLSIFNDIAIKNKRSEETISIEKMVYDIVSLSFYYFDKEVAESVSISEFFRPELMLSVKCMADSYSENDKVKSFSYGNDTYDIKGYLIVEENTKIKSILITSVTY